MPFERQYDADELLDLCREHDGLPTRELAERMGANEETTRHRCYRLTQEGLLTSMLWGFGRRRTRVWYAVE